jgi:hypothetical protein
MRNGMGSGESAVSDRLRSIDWDNAGKLESAESDCKSEHRFFSPEEEEALKSVKLDSEEMVGILTEIIRRAGLLSGKDPKEGQDAWSSARFCRAADELFQVVVNPTKKTFEVDSLSGVYMVPGEPRSLYDILVVGVLHELTHVVQAQADQEVGRNLKIANMQGKRVGGLREAGADIAQRQGEEVMFGHSKPFAPTYLRALEVLEGGKSVGEAIKVFYDEKIRLFPFGSKQDFAREAADRVLRLVREDGVNSQPLAYVEESILAEELKGVSSKVRERATKVTSLDLVDQVRLHQYDLLPSIGSSTAIDWMRIALEVMEPRINEVFEKAELAGFNIDQRVNEV